MVPSCTLIATNLTMAAAKYQASSSSRFSHCKYQVFLSFRGEDTRKNFTDHLYTALVQAGIHTFRDDDEIGRGENIESELQKAILQSKIAIIVFSKDYASSRWCLDELVMIMERRRTADCIVLPVFYDVDPSQVRKQTGSFAAAFVEHEKRFKEEMEQVNGWRIALKKVADLAGMVLGDEYEVQFIHSIVEKVSKKLDRKIFHVPLHFIGRDTLVEYINSWLQDGSHGASVAILYGIGGVGKTAIAKRVYNQNFHKFEGRSFLSNVRERSNESNGVVCLQRKLLSDILSKTADEVHDIDEGVIKIKDALCCKRTLIVLDDVDKRDQFSAIVGMKNWLCQGSKIIVTTRNKGLIAADDEFVKFKVEPLNNKKSLELFSWHAFGQAYPVEDFVEDSWRIVHHCNGLPLALRVISSSLSGKRRKVWESVILEIGMIPNCEVQKVLGISYDFLDDDCQKNVFLDIACFFNGMDVDDAVRILDGLGIGARFRIDNLIDRCLVEIVEINHGKRLWMHQLIRDMGREIACKESSKYQRIWRHMEAFTMLKETTDAEKLHGLTLDMHALMKDSFAEVVSTNSMVPRKRRRLNFFEQCRLPIFLSWEWLSDIFLGEQEQIGQTPLFPVLSTNAFRKMQNVKFLQLNYMKFNGSYEYFPKKLIWLCWHGFSLGSIPMHLCLEKLVVLDLSRSRLVDAWRGKLSLPKLKIIDLRHSHDLIRTPDFSGLPNLEKLILEDCIHLVQIHESIGVLQSLLILNLKNCKSIVELPEEISRLNSLEKLVLDGCLNLECLNMELEHHQGRRLLQSEGIVASIPYITSLRLKLFFPSIFLARKNSRFSSLSLPHYLKELDLSGTAIRFLPESIKDHSTLKYLLLENCKMLQTLPELPSNLFELDVSFCCSLKRVTNLIPVIRARGCDQLADMQDWMKAELIQKADSHMFRIMETISVQMQPREFEILLHKGNIFSVVIEYDEKDEMSKWFYEEEEEDMWVIQNEFVGYLSLKISSPDAHRICGFNLFTTFSAMSEFIRYRRVSLEIRNNTKGRVRVFYPSELPLKLAENFEFLWLNHWKFGSDDAEFDNGDDVSVSVFTDDPVVQIKRVDVQMLLEEEGNDDGNIHSSNEAIKSHSSSSSNCEVIPAHTSSGDDDGYVAKAEVASHIFTNYYCTFRCCDDEYDSFSCNFEKK